MYKLYLAYGSNLSLEQMAWRCPHAYPVAAATLKGHRLLYKGSQSGSYLTVEPSEGDTVPLVVWHIDADDEAMLDRYEGCPNFYYKKDMEVELDSLLDGSPMGTGTGIIYIMHEERPLGRPSLDYVRICLEGYERFHLTPKFLDKALEDSIGTGPAHQMMKKLRKAMLRKEVF